jgi:hypothetical protein
MKKHYYLLSVIALALVLTLPVATRTHAESGDDDDDDKARVTAPSTAQKLRAKIQNENLKNNQDARNKLLASSTRVEKIEVKDLRRTLDKAKENIQDAKKENIREVRDLRKDAKDDLKRATSSMVRKEIKSELRLDIFKAQMSHLVRQLNLALNNLRQIRDRIQARIIKAESTGRNMTEAKTLLVTADLKITAAQQSINALAAFNASTSVAVGTTTGTTTATTSVHIRLDKPRQVGAAAIKAVKDAREALNAVVRAIAHNMGFGAGGRATTTPPIGTTTPPTSTTTPPTSTTTPPTSTTTATTTP